MSVNKMFSLLESLVEHTPEEFYENLRNKMNHKVYEKSQTILDCGETVKYLYYLEKGFARGLDKNGDMVWFCEENEIILFNKFSHFKSCSTYQIIVEKHTTIYRVSIRDVFEFADQKFIINFLSACVDASQYFLGLQVALRKLTIKEKLLFLSKDHNTFMNARLELVSSFLYASISRISTARKHLVLEKKLAISNSTYHLI